MLLRTRTPLRESDRFSAAFAEASAHLAGLGPLGAMERTVNQP